MNPLGNLYYLFSSTFIAQNDIFEMKRTDYTPQPGDFPMQSMANFPVEFMVALILHITTGQSV